MIKFVYPQDTHFVQYMKTISGIKHINRLKVKNHLIISIDTERAIGELCHSFQIQPQKKLGQEGAFSTQ